MTAAMKKVRIVVLGTEVDPVVRYLGTHGYVQVTSAAEVLPAPADDGSLGLRLQEARKILGSGVPGEFPDALGGPPVTLSAGEEEGLSEILALGTRLDQWRHRSGENSRLRAVLGDFRGLDLSWNQWEGLGNLDFQVGALAPEKAPSLAAGLGPQGVLAPLATPGRFGLLGPRGALEGWSDLLGTHGFIPVPRPTPGDAGNPDLPLGKRLEELETEALSLAEEGRALEADRLRLAGKWAADLGNWWARWSVDRQVRTLAATLEAGGSLRWVEGWVPARAAGPLAQDLKTLTGGQIAVTVRDPLDGEAVPTLLTRQWGTKGFEKMVANYGAPVYGTVDPTQVVSLTYVLFFAVMFGDVGQGFCIFLAGILLGRGIPGLLGWEATAPVFRKVGLAAMVSGLVYGSVFSSETLLVPLTRTVTGWFGPPADHFFSLMPIDSPTKLFGFFGFTIGLGVIVNSVGLVFNLVNNLKLRRWEAAFLPKTGVAGTLFFWYGLFFALRVLWGGQPVGWDWLGFGLPLAVLLLGPSVVRWASGRSPFEEGPGMFGMSVVTETLETFTYFLSNTLSFLRVGAFALSHAVLSLIFYTLGGLAAQGASWGWVFGALIIVLGNVLILGLEGLIVAIQILRLEYYEFFSKFFNETGTEFRPFQFTFQGDLP